MIQIFVALLLSFAQAHAGHVETPVRAGLGFQNQNAPKFTDENILSAIQYAVQHSKVSPLAKIKIDGGQEQLSIILIGDGKAEQFTFKVENGKSVFEQGPMTGMITHQVEVPFGSLQSYGFKQPEITSYSEIAAWTAVAVVGVYAAKKVLNKMTIGKFSAAGEEHEHGLFPTDQEMRAEMNENREIMEKATAKAQEAVDGELLTLVKPLAQAAACGHATHGDHDHAHDHDPEPSGGFVCEAIDEQQAQAAQQTLLKSFASYGVRFGRDFYGEIVEPIVGLVKAAGDKDTRRQIWNFFDLISRRMIKERGVPAAVVTGAFVGVGQLVVEVLESFVMPAGLHMFCQVGNAAVLVVAAKAYSTYFCMTQHTEFKNKTIADRWRTAQTLSRLSKTGASVNFSVRDLIPAGFEWLPLGNSSADKEASVAINAEDEKIIHALHLLFRLVERDLRHARNIEHIEKPTAHALATRLGDLRRELTLISIRLINKNSPEGEVKDWLQRLHQVQTEARGCAAFLEVGAA